MDEPAPELLLGRSFGEDVSAWPQLKVSRAVQHMKDLEGRLVTWVSGKPFTFEKRFSEDRLQWRQAVKVSSPPPLFEWSLIVGDCFNNLRASLDACIWELAHLDGAAPPRPNQLAFPIVTDESKWVQARRYKLQTVPDDIAARIQVLQPFRRAPEGVGRDALVVLSKLNNIDKHRSNIAVNIEGDQININARIAWESPDAAQRNLPPQVSVYEPRVIDGAVFMEITSPDRMASVKGGSGFRFKVTIDTGNDARENVFQLADNLIRYVQTIHASLLEGLVKDEPGKPS